MTNEISVAYLGITLDEGRMEASLVGESLRGLGRLANRVSYITFGSRYDHRLIVKGDFQSGSFVIPLDLVSQALESGRSVLDSRAAQELATLLGILGWGIVPGTISVFTLFKRKRGRPITSGDDLTSLLEGYSDVEKLLLVRIFNDFEVRAALRSALRALRAEGIEQFETRVNARPIEAITKDELRQADDAELEAVDTEEERTLDIEKVALLPHLAWHFSDMGRPFDAQVQDATLWSRIANGEKFGYGDRLRVILRTEMQQMPSGRFSYTRTIPRVLEVEHTEPSQLPLFPE